MVLADFPLFWNHAMLDKGMAVATMHDLPSRFALVPRGGGDIRWFEAKPTYVLHFVNAFEDGDEVVLDGYRQQHPVPAPLAGHPKGMAMLMANLDIHSLKPQLWRWRFNLQTGETREAALDERICEFGSINRRHAGKPHRHVYSALGEPGWFMFSGLCKRDLQTGREQAISFGPGVFGSETPFAPRIGSTAEDDGYLVTFVTDVNRNLSECWIYHAQDLAAGPLAKARLPARIPSGTHAYWASAGELSP
jgi:carotenoid cleavage dioxygenase